MVFYASELWELSLDCIGLLLCGVALIQLFRLHRQSEVPRGGAAAAKAADKPMTDIRQLVDTQGREALKEFSETIRRERELLVDILDARCQGSDTPPPFEAVLADAGGSVTVNDDSGESPETDETVQPLPRVIQLVQSGLDVDAIHRETGVARGEIALLKAMDEQGHPFQELRICA